MVGNYQCDHWADVDTGPTQRVGLNANAARLRQARLDMLASQYKVRGFAKSLIAGTEQIYWYYPLAERQVEIVLNAPNTLATTGGVPPRTPRICAPGRELIDLSMQGK